MQGAGSREIEGKDLNVLFTMTSPSQSVLWVRSQDTLYVTKDDTRIQKRLNKCGMLLAAQECNYRTEKVDLETG